MLEIIQASFLLFLSICLLFVTIFWCGQVLSLIRRKRVGFIPTVSKEVENSFVQIFDEFKVNPKDYFFVELGAGMAGMSRFAFKKFEFREVWAVEVSQVLVFLARILNFKYGTKIKFFIKDIFKFDYPENSILYCYLGTNIMKLLHQQGCFKNKLVISLTFKIPDLEPAKAIKVNSHYKRLLVYDFRKKDN